MLDEPTFNTIIENAPLISIDLCLLCRGEILLCKRSNEPLSGEWFTPGGRLYKNEMWQNALLRILRTELSLAGLAVEDFTLMGLWDHFYSNSIFNQDSSTHYVNLPHYSEFKSHPEIVLDDQHSECKWFDVSVVSNDEKFHPYMRNYASWLLNKMEDKYD
jgi:colanic acid biosynthesis protein WcaH